MSSDPEGSGVTFGAALVNDTFLRLVRKETHRGLEGRALYGFATGGKCYTYGQSPSKIRPAQSTNAIRLRVRC
jgi:hypothetical protein